MNKEQLLAHMDTKRKTNNAILLAKQLVGLCNYSNPKNVTLSLFLSFKESIFADIFLLSAKLFTQENPYVCQRLERGKQLLAAVAITGYTYGENKAEQIPLSPLPNYAKTESNQTANIKSIINDFINFAQTDQQHQAIASEALMIALRTEHPTISQSFIGAFRDASLACEINSKYSFIGNAYKEYLPFI